MITIIRDSREKANYWEFAPSEFCLGTICQGLKVGDYSILGIEDEFTIERKYSTGELAGNFFESRWPAFLDKLSKYKWKYIICEFTYFDVVNFPLNSGIPKDKLKYLKMTPQLFMKKIAEIQVIHNIPVIFAGKYGDKAALSIFKRVNEQVNVTERDD